MTAFDRPRSIADGASIPRIDRMACVRLVRTVDADADMLRAHGATRSASGWWIRRDAAPFPFEALEAHLPRIARRTVVPLVVDLIPSTAWHASLANVLMDADWARVRGAVAHEAGGCVECGTGFGTECHEIWSYDAPSLVQRLEGFEALCRGCHETRHLGLAGVRGRLGEAMDRLCAVNRLEASERVPYGALVRQNFEVRSRHRWDLDLSYAAGSGLRLRRSLAHAGDGVVRGEAKGRGVSFRLTGTRFSAGPGGVSID